jgi:hypothetical protein
MDLVTGTADSRACCQDTGLLLEAGDELACGGRIVRGDEIMDLDRVAQCHRGEGGPRHWL